MGASAWFHPDLADKPKLVEPVLRALARILEAGAVLHPKIKSLKGPWPGTHRLTFAKKERALFSWRQDETEQRVPWVHEIGWRAEVYERARGIARARAWSEARNRADGGDCGGLVALGYKLKETQAAPCDEDEVDILPVLSPEQEVFLDSLLPLERTTGNPHAFVRLGVGPPGSGKTVVAVEAAQAARYRNCDVLVLVPTSGLLTTYKRELGRVTVVEDGRFADAPEDSEDEPRVWVERAGPFFDALAKHEFLEDPVVTWWAKVLELPAIQAWKTKHPCVKTPPFVQLIDALLFDDRAGGGGQERSMGAAVRAAARCHRRTHGRRPRSCCIVQGQAPCRFPLGAGETCRRQARGGATR